MQLGHAPAAVPPGQKSQCRAPAQTGNPAVMLELTFHFSISAFTELMHGEVTH